MWDRLNLKGKFLRESIIKYQNWLPEEVIDLPGSEDFKTCILMLLLDEILWSRQPGKKKETGLSVPGEPPDLESPKSGPNLLHVLICYFSICSMGEVKTHCTALDALWRESGKIFHLCMFDQAHRGLLFLGWYFLPVWGIRAAAAGAVGTVWRATVVLCRRVLLL